MENIMEILLTPLILTDNLVNPYVKFKGLMLETYRKWSE